VSPEGVKPPDRLGVAQWAVDIVRGLTIQNILTMGLLLVVAVPAYFSWRFLHDTDFRHEFMSTSRFLEMNVPCLVIQGNIAGQGERISVAVAFELRGRMEHMVVIRAPGMLSDQEIQTACALAHDDANLIKAAIAARDAKASEGK
jgi:hypothetical protein